MTRYQINLLVDIEADSDDAAHEIAENVAEFLGLHYQTTTSGLVKELLIVEDEEEFVDPYDELMTDEDADIYYAGA
jgi:hypothetical protein